MNNVDDEIKLKYDKLSNYIDDYKQKLYLSNDIKVPITLKTSSSFNIRSGTKKSKIHFKNPLQAYKKIKCQIDYKEYKDQNRHNSYCTGIELTRDVNRLSTMKHKIRCMLDHNNKLKLEKEKSGIFLIK